MHAQPLICVADVEASSRWYRRLLGCRSDHGGPNYERRIADVQPADRSGVPRLCRTTGPAGPTDSSPGREPGVSRFLSAEPRQGRKSPGLPPLPGLGRFFYFTPGSRPGLLSAAPPALMTATSMATMIRVVLASPDGTAADTWQAIATHLPPVLSVEVQTLR